MLPSSDETEVKAYLSDTSRVVKNAWSGRKFDDLERDGLYRLYLEVDLPLGEL